MPSEHDIILEFITLGNSVKVTAIDPESGIEAVVVASPHTPRSVLSDLALRKLRYVTARRDEKKEE